MRTNLFLLLLTVASAAAANEPLGWSGQGEAGIQKASGNTDSETVNLGLAFLWTNQDWSNEFDLSVYKSSNNGLDSANSVEAGYTLKRELTERSNLFFSLSYLDDEFDGFNEQSSVSAGYGYKVFDTETLTWETSIGVGYRDAEQVILPEIGSTDEIQFVDVGGATGVLRSKFKKQITENTKFKWNIKSEIGSDNTFVQSDAALFVSMNARFSLKAQLLVRHNTDPAPMLDETDTISMLSLVYNFGDQPKAE
ncbi:DUF481 domain-containing protein [Arenicella xantha]|uniref:Putative salt-induced outer membrane protein YdiY n=1 Tax=Arenicella xantha TaxID=644221 RepID=A0A395JRA4_9GAMM|nr:DUF481 domain-containing protein [Arenicella xantha]RBP52862.1 putative salt-induced outer membrane protein YdiY [Arenicella xantha]